MEVDGKVTLNSRFLLDALNVLEGKTVKVGFSNKLDPIVLKSEQDAGYIHIIMPLKG